MSIWFRKDIRDTLTRRAILLVLIMDAASSVGALAVAHLVRFKIIPGGVLAHNHLITASIIISGSLLYLLIMRLLNGYHPHTLIRLRRNYQVVFKAGLIWLITLPSITLFLEILPTVSRVFLLLGFVFLILAAMTGRLLILNLLRATGLINAMKQRVLFIDWSPKMEFLADQISRDSSHPYVIAGIAPPEGNRFTHPPSPAYPVLGSHQEVERLFHKGLIQIAMLADVTASDLKTASLISLCERHLVTFMMIPKNFQILLTGLQVTSISGVPVLGITELPLEKPLNAMMKRVMDLVGSLIGLLLFMPVILLFSILVIVESPGNPFYTQIRAGKNGRKFKIIKIRSMKLDAETGIGAQWATIQDPRRLKVGAFMRRWNIDEFPQFWNVLVGEMSLVGPRPERPELIMNFRETIQHYNARHNIVPGMTGWAAVNGLRGDTDLQERVQYDLYYADNWSIALDLQIILMTFRNRNSGA